MKKDISLSMIVCSSLVFMLLTHVEAQGWRERARGIEKIYSSEERMNTYKALINYKEGYIEFEATAGVREDITNPVQQETVAKETARYLAYIKVAEFINGVLMKNEIGIGEGVARKMIAEGKVEGWVKRAILIDEKFEWITGHDGKKYPKGTARIGILLYDDQKPSLSLLQLYMPDAIEQVKVEGITDYEPASLPSNISKNVTGLIIDAKDLNVSPAIYAQIFVEGAQKQSIYGQQKVSHDYATRYGIFAYAKGFDEAKNNERVEKNGVSNPMIVKAVSAEGLDNKILVVTKDDAASILAANVYTNFLEECRVIVVVD